MTWQVQYSKRALNDLETIYLYIKEELKAPNSASKITKKIMKQVSALNEMPLRFPLYKNNIRKLIVDNFIAYYLTNEETAKVTIIAILYSKRNINKLI